MAPVYIIFMQLTPMTNYIYLIISKLSSILHNATDLVYVYQKYLIHWFYLSNYIYVVKKSYWDIELYWTIRLFPQ